MGAVAGGVANAGSVSVLDPTALEVGDVVLTATKSAFGQLVRTATGGPVSHAALHVGGGFLVEAVRSGVHKIHSRCFAFGTGETVSVLRPEGARTAQRQEASQIARGLVYRPYSIQNAIATRVPFLRRTRDPGRFCSEVVAEAFAAVDFPLLESAPSRTAPKDLLASTHLTDVSDQAVRSIDAGLWKEVSATLDPKTFSIPDWPNEEVWLRAYEFEETIHGWARRRWKLFAPLRQPYHYFDLFRILSEAAETNETLAKKLDTWLYERLDGLRSVRFVLPKGVADMLTDRPIMWDIDGRGLGPSAREEFERLLRELHFGKDWNLEDWAEGLAEMQSTAHRLELMSLYFASNMMQRDKAWVQEEYRMLWPYI